jgi:hypothetical protein
MFEEEQIRKFLGTKEGKEIFLKIFFEVYKAEKKEKKKEKEKLTCPSCGMLGRYGTGNGGYLVFWHWEKDEATGLKKRKWCYIGKVVEVRETETLDKKPVFVIVGKKSRREKNLIPPNAPQSI